MGIQGLGPASNHPPLQSPNEGAGQADRVEARNNEGQAGAHAGATSGDSVQISAEARLAAKAQEAAKAEDPQEVRPDKVQAAKEFLQAGLYDDQGVLEQTADSVAAFINAEL